MHGALIIAFVTLAALCLQGCSHSAIVANGTWLETSAFTKYFNYEGILTVSGTVTVFSHWGSPEQDMNGSLAGVDPFCNGTQTGESNKCGVHIHEGTDCTSDAGGHFYNATRTGGSDPWIPITYTDPIADEADGQVTFKIENIYTGHADVSNRVVVVHDSSGARIACAQLSEKSNTQSSIRAASDDASGDMPWILIVVMTVFTIIGGWSYYYRSRGLSYGAQQDETVEVQDLSPVQGESIQNTA